MKKRFNSSKYRLMDGITPFPAVPGPTTVGSDNLQPGKVPRFNQDTLVGTLGISEELAAEITKDGDVTEKQVFEFMQKRYSFKSNSGSPTIKEKGTDKFEDFANSKLLYDIESLDPTKNNIDVENNKIVWKDQGAENLEKVQHDSTDVLKNIQEADSLEKTLSEDKASSIENPLKKFLKKTGYDGATDIKYAGSVKPKGLQNDKHEQFHVFTFKDKNGEEKVIALDASLKKPITNFKEFTDSLGVDQYNELTGNNKINSDNFWKAPS